MKFNTHLTIWAAMAALILFFSACEIIDAACEQIEPLDCPPPESLGINYFSEAGDSIEFVWNSVSDASSYDFRLVVNQGDPLVDEQELTDTTYLYTPSNFALGDELEISVRANCGSDCHPNTESPWTTIFRINKNGGATVDPVPSFKLMETICDPNNPLPCTYVRFKDDALALCDGTLKKLKLEDSRYTFFDKDALCGCLAAPSTLTFCEKLINIEEECFNTLPKYIGHAPPCP